MHQRVHSHSYFTFIYFIAVFSEIGIQGSRQEAISYDKLTCNSLRYDFDWRCNQYWTMHFLICLFPAAIFLRAYKKCDGSCGASVRNFCANDVIQTLSHIFLQVAKH